MALQSSEFLELGYLGYDACLFLKSFTNIWDYKNEQCNCDKNPVHAYEYVAFYFKI